MIIDPGHGGMDPGARGISSGVLEKNLSLDLALRLSRLLRKAPSVAVLNSRNSDMAIEISRRAEIANNAQGSLLISLHAGTSKNHGMRGGRAYFYGESPLPDPRLGQDPTRSRDVITSSRRPFRKRSLELVPWGQAHLGFDTASNDLATSLQSEMNTLYDLTYQVQALPLYLLKGLAMPSVIVEVGYLSNPEDDQLLQTEQFRSRLVHALSTGIMNYVEQTQRFSLRDP